MKDKSKRLTVVNTGKKPSEKKDMQQVVVQSSSSSSSHASGFNSNLYLLKSVWDSVFEIKTDGNGQKYIFGKLPVVTKYGITMYADDGNVDIPQLAEGLPFDQRTIWFNPETKQIEVIGGTGGGVSNFWDLSGIPSWITNSKPIYNYSEIKNTPDLSVFVTGTALSKTLADYATLTYLTGELKKYVTLDGAQDIKGVKNFVNGLKIGGMPITKLQDDVIYIDANVVVRGGVTMYGTDEGDLPSILDSLPIASNTALGIASFDSTYFSVDSNGMVSLTSAPSSDAPSLGELLNVDESNDAVASVDRVLFQSAGSNVWSWKALSEIGGGSSGGSVSGDYLPLSGGTINGSGSYSAIPLVIKNSNSQFNGLSIYAYTTERVHLGYWSSLGGVRLENVACTAGLSILDDKTPSYYKINSDGTIVKDAILHAGNYSSYALPLSGGTIDGKLRINDYTRIIQLGEEYTLGKSKNSDYVPSGTIFHIVAKENNVSSASLINFDTKAINGGTNGVFIGGVDSGLSNGASNFVIGRRTGTSTWAESLRIDANGNVGIGTTSPASQLDVNGTVLSHYVRTSYNNSAGFSEYEALNYTRAWFANTQTLSVPYNSVQVALGWSNWLQGQGYHTRYTISSVRFNGWGGMSLAVGANDKGTYRGVYLELWGSGTISAGGNLTVSGGITMYSDIRKKTKLQDVELSLSQIANAPLIEHYYNSDQNKTTHVGSIAQYWAGLNDWFCKLDNEGFYTMEIQNCALASAISIARHLEKYESKTDKTIRKMKQRIQELEDKLEKLEGGNYGCN